VSGRAALGSVLAAVALALPHAGCARLAAPAPRIAAPIDDPVAALVARERSLAGLRLSLRIRDEGPDGATPAAPAFLAVERPGRLRLQVLSLFGATVLDLEIAGDRFRLRLPMQSVTRRGRVDPTALAAAAEGDRMVMALALLFRGDAAACVAISARSARCPLGGGATATVDLDRAGRPVRERLADAGGRPLLVAEYAGYEAPAPTAVPRTIVLSDPRRGATTRVRVLRVRTGA